MTASTDRRCAFYACIGAELAAYRVDVDEAALVHVGSVRLPAQIQYGWQHPTRPFFYVASSSGYVSSKDLRTSMPQGEHFLSAFRLNERTGMLDPLNTVPLPTRPVHITVDACGEHVLAAHPVPAGITVHEVRSDGTIGARVDTAGTLDTGIYPHQIRVTPGGRTVVLVTRGHNPQHGSPEEPGALKVFGYGCGSLSNRSSIAVNGGYGYGPRHLDFHPTRPWVYVSLERQNQVHMHELLGDGDLSPEPLFIASTLAAPADERERQGAGAIHVHPNGRTVYVANRSSSAKSADGRRIFGGGEDNIAVFSIDERTGRPQLIQTADAQGFHPRTFSIEPGGRLLMSSAQFDMRVPRGNDYETVPGGISLFAIRGDGTLDFIRKYPLDTRAGDLWWSGTAVLPV